ncbi:glycosyltransferase family 2 protein [Paenibacillus sp. BAC0078]
MPEITIIIPTYEKAFYLDLTLAGFVGQTKKDFEIIIINDGSEDHTEQIINKYSNLDIKYLHQHLQLARRAY